MGRKNTIDTSAIVNFIKTSKEPVSRKEIIEATGYKGDFSYAIKCVLREDSDIVKIQGANPSLNKYTTNSLRARKEAASEMKNPEGYSDGTAGKAIANVMRSTNGGRYPMRQSFGEVWSSSNVVDDQEGFLVVSAKEGVCICYGVYPSKKSFMKADYTMRWTDDRGQTHFISTINPVNLSERKLLKKLGTLGAGEKECLKISALRALGIDIPEAEEKIKVVEVSDPKAEKKVLEYSKQCDDLLSKNEALRINVEKAEKENIELRQKLECTVQPAIEYRTDPVEIEMAVLRAKCDIYEKLIFDKGNPYLTRFRAAV